ncbi:MAG: class I SAM-dependent methyltransferase [Planctomycetia bacterium]|nr:class I SAM-dependent methyltransferase [Planctomycetia bacterium]
MRPCATTLEAEMTPLEHEYLLRLIGDAHHTGKHLEIGTAAGGTLCAMMGCFDDQQRPPFVVVDRMTYFPDQAATVRRNLSQRGLDPNQVDFRVATSAAAFADAEERGDVFDFMLIDSCHKILAVMADLRWTRLLAVGGILCLHDYCPKFPGVMRAVDRFLSQYPNYERMGLAGSLLAIRKATATAGQEVTPLDQAYALAWHLPLVAQRKIDKWRAPQRAAA